MDLLTVTWPLGPAIGAFLAGALAIALVGARLARVVDRLADRTGLGEAVAGAVLLAAATSIAGMVVSLVAAGSGDASLAVSNSVGGIAVQTAFIVVADLFYRRANLEHAAASSTNMFNSMLMTVLLAVVVLGTAAPQVTVLGIHPATFLLLFMYGYGITLSRRVHDEPMWRPAMTADTELDEADAPEPGETLRGLWVRFGVLAAGVSVSGWLVARAGISITEATQLSGTFVGAFLTSVASSLPELVTTVAAVRAGALTLAVGGIVGGNVFDVLFVAFADVAYRDGSLYAAVAPSDLFVVGWGMLLVGVLATGLVRRERGGIGFEGVAILVLYAGGLATVAVMGA